MKRPRLLLIIVCSVLAVIVFRLLSLRHSGLPGHLNSGALNPVKAFAVDETTPRKITTSPPGGVNRFSASKDATVLPGSQNSNQEPATVAWHKRYETPISFDGRVVDENEQPVAGADVQFSCVNGMPQGGPHYKATSDARGLFSLRGARGKTLGITVSKPGYYTAGSRAVFTFEYADAGDPDYFQYHADAPVVFHLRKKGPGAPLITSQYGVTSALGVTAPRDGSPVWVDLLRRQVGSVGQLEIRQIKPDLEHWKEANEWSFQISVPGGGIIETLDEFPFEAPQDGYQPFVALKFKAGETGWTTSFRKRFYVAFGQPRLYGLLSVDTRIDAGSRFEYLINPSGDRYLEPDPSRSIQVESSQ